MRILKALLIVCFSLFVADGLYAQIVADPTTWTIEAKKKNGNEYQIIFHLKLKETWHIWSMKPGGDGMEIPPTFTFKPNDNVKLKGSLTEHGKKLTGTMD